jgi:hypothetical protein
VSGVGYVPPGVPGVQEGGRAVGVRSVREPAVRLDETGPGDVFYKEADPSTVWTCQPSRIGDGYMFIWMEGEAWRRMEHVGQPGDPVIVIHNTRNERIPGEPPRDVLGSLT